MKAQQKTIIRKLFVEAEKDFIGHKFPNFPPISKEKKQVQHLTIEQWKLLLRTVFEFGDGKEGKARTLKQYKSLSFNPNNRDCVRNWVDLYHALQLEWFFYLRAEDMCRLKSEWFTRKDSGSWTCFLETTKKDRELHQTSHYRRDADSYLKRIKGCKPDGYLIFPHITRPVGNEADSPVLLNLNFLLKKAIEKQSQLVNQETRKTGVSKKMQKQMSALENSGTEIRESKFEQQNYWSNELTTKKIDVTVINNFTKDLVNNVECGMYDSYWGVERRREWTNEGIRRGVVLGKKLKVRAEQKDTKFNRLRSGKIDKRRISNAGFGVENIFAKIESFAYNPGLIHISIDNSGSMGGGRFENAVTTSVAIAKACSMIENMDCVISFRAGSSFAGTDAPVVLIAYDSRKHGMNQIKTMMPYCCTSGVTPEGLCFEAIMKEIVSSAKGKDAYFVNMSDGMPYYNDYSGEAAWKHTRMQVKNMTKEGIKVISYFITGSNGIHESERNAFNAMYGKEAQYINTKKINEVAKSMNSKFLEIA